ncbi:MAG: hypothetical protein AAF438_18880, partial [Pseudomonadota bacterium]
MTSAVGRAGAPALLSLMACPDCGGELKQQGKEITCCQCGLHLPLVANGGGLHPWAFKKPQQALLEWKARLNGFLANNAAEQRRLNKALVEAKLRPSTYNRIRRKLQATEIHKAQVLDVLSPLKLEGLNFEDADPGSLIRSKLPKSQGLTGYYTNVFRDWVWGDQENQQMLKTALSLLGDDAHGPTLTLGCGSGRLSYDLHQKLNPSLSVALDLNPFLVLLASRVISGETLPLVEFPVAPLEKDVIHQECVSPRRLSVGHDTRFAMVMGDALQPPFVDQCFNAVVTPWLVDIVPQDFTQIARTVNNLLTQDGVWANTGSLAFFHNNEDWRYSEEELLEVLADSGFEVTHHEWVRQPYLQSPHSGHHRTEAVFSFSAKKRTHLLRQASEVFLPNWLTDQKQPVPSDAEYLVTSSSHLLKAQIMSAIDGKRSLDDIAHLVARQYQLDPGEALQAVQRILVDHYETN